MRSQVGRVGLRMPVGLRAGIVIGAALALVGVAVGTATGVQQAFQAVLVVNPASSPVPVVGARADGTLAVSGSVNVTASSPLPVAGTINVGNLPSTQPVSGTVSIGAVTRIIDSGTTSIPSFDFAYLVNNKDVSAYKSVSLYVNIASSAANQELVASTSDGGNIFPIEIFSVTDPQFVRSWDPAPPNITLLWNSSYGSTVVVDWMLIGRTD